MLCALCRKDEREEISHIIPAFIYRKLRKITPSGRLRATSNPNRRVQDGLKFPLLCPQCEDKLSKWEKKFAETIFHPYYSSSKNNFSFTYEEWFLKFLVSISYRALVSMIEKEELGNHSRECIRTMKCAKGIWQSFLLDKRSDVSVYKQYFFILPIDAETESVFLQKHNAVLKFYLLTATDSDTIYRNDDSEVYLITKFGEFFVVASIIDSQPSQWKDLVIDVFHGEFQWSPVVQTSPLVIKFIEHAIQDVLSTRENISQGQAEQIKLGLEDYLRKHNIEDQG